MTPPTHDDVPSDSATCMHALQLIVIVSSPVCSYRVCLCYHYKQLLNVTAGHSASWRHPDNSTMLILHIHFDTNSYIQYVHLLNSVKPRRCSAVSRASSKTNDGASLFFGVKSICFRYQSPGSLSNLRIWQF